MKIGARVFKTGLAVTLSIIISYFIIPDNSPSLAAIAAVTTLMPSVRRSVDMFQRRVLANLIGGVVAVLVLSVVGSNALTIGLTVILTIAVLNSLKLSDVLSLACITAIIVMLSEPSQYHIIAIYRVLETIVGVIVAFLVNTLILPPRHDTLFYSTLSSLSNEILMFIRATLRKNTTYSILHRDLKWANKELAKVRDLFDLMHNEVIFSRKHQYVQARRLVIYRQMLLTTQALVQLLEALHQNDAIFLSFPDELRIRLRERLEVLMTGHEQILMKFSGRVSASEVRYIRPQQDFKLQFLDDFYHMAREIILAQDLTEHDSHGVIHLLSMTYQYEDALTRLNELIRIYKERTTSNHQHDEQIGNDQYQS